MTGSIFFIALLAILAALPAIGGWKLGQKYEQFTRMACTILGGQLILTTGVGLIVLFGGGPDGANPLRTVIIYAAMALAISIMTFAILEMKNTGGKKP
ncbi:hypothetical protein AB1K62_03675 [Parasphingorhabdus sp. JC815]|uniref:hypothetical protein n=1 Tax=Parasphingorhabdus sp. JC815 TaxID=3232140 RepID=UPI00345A1A00